MMNIKGNKNCNIKINDKTISILSAKEMFEKLGYGQIIGTKEKYTYEFIQYRNIKEQRWITFEFGTVNCGKYDDPVEPMDITMQELQAINKQIEELGWNK